MMNLFVVDGDACGQAFAEGLKPDFAPLNAE
jgi:hypothetical protein